MTDTIQTTSTAWSDVPDMALDVNVTDADVHAAAMFYASAEHGRWRIAVDGVGSEVEAVAVEAVHTPVRLNVLFKGLTVGLHRFTVQWCAEAGVAEMIMGSGRDSLSTHPQFFVRAM